VTNHQPADPPTDETSQVQIPSTQSECANPVEAALWRALREARRERDEARRWFCQRAEWLDGGDGTQTASEHGWDCFKEDTQ
jgi:hypothetical protein